MSRGPGWVQGRIRAALVRREPILSAALLWSIAESGDHVEDGHISDALYKSYRRSLGALKDAKVLHAERRLLVSMREVLKFYPDHSRDAAVRDMRRKLLPTFASILDDTEIDATDVERRAFDAHASEWSRNGMGAAKVRTAWRALEAQIAQVMPHVRRDDRELLAQVLGKVGEYLGTRSVHRVETTLRGQLARLRRRSGSARQLARVVAMLDELCQMVLPMEVVQRLTMKSQLWQHVTYGRPQRPTLRPGTKKRLFELAPDVVAALEGHKPRDPSTDDDFSRLLWPARELPPTVDAFSPLLDRLVGRDALSWFEFLTPVASPPLERSR